MSSLAGWFRFDDTANTFGTAATDDDDDELDDDAAAGRLMMWRGMEVELDDAAAAAAGADGELLFGDGRDFLFGD